MSNSLLPHGLQHTRPSCPSPTPWACSNSCPLSRWCHPTISSSVVPFSSHLQSFPASGSFPMSQFFASGGQSIGVSASTSVLPMNIQDWFPLGLTGLISLKGNAKECSNNHTVALISHASKVMLKILQVKLQQYMNREFSDAQAGFRKDRGTWYQIANIRWIIEKASTSASMTKPKPLTLWITTNCGKFFKSWEYQTTLPASWEISMQVKKQQ